MDKIEKKFSSTSGQFCEITVEAVFSELTNEFISKIQEVKETLMIKSKTS